MDKLQLLLIARQDQAWARVRDLLPEIEELNRKIPEGTRENQIIKMCLYMVSAEIKARQ